LKVDLKTGHVVRQIQIISPRPLGPQTEGEPMSDELLETVKSGDATKVKALLQSGADCNARDAEGATALMLAAGAGNLDMVKALLAAGADVKATDERGWTALMKSTYNDQLDRGFPHVTQALIDAGADVEAKIAYGTRPLMIAAGYGEAGVVEVLLKAGADPRAKNDGGRTALMMVKDKDYVEVINLLHEAELDLGDEQGCGSRNPPNANVVTFLKPEKH
jgi:ankyrin repeat protein